MNEPLVVDFVCQLLEAARRPLTAQELASQLQSRGVNLTREQLNKVLWDKRFRRPGLEADRNFRWSWASATQSARPGVPLPAERPTQLRLYDFLRGCESADRTFTKEQAAQGSGLSEVSIRTYLSKKLIDRWVFSTDGQHYCVRGLLAASEKTFAAVMTQKAAPPADTEQAWRAEVEKLISEGMARGYRVEEALTELAARTRARRARAG